MELSTATNLSFTTNDFAVQAEMVTGETSIDVDFLRLRLDL